MNDFKEKLLKTLLNNNGNPLNIQPLVVEQCGIFTGNDNKCITCRLAVTRILSELIELNWIRVGEKYYEYALQDSLPTFDMKTVRQYTEDPLMVVLTTRGETEYKKSIETPVAPMVNNITARDIINSPIGNYGLLEQALINPATHTITKTPSTNASKTSLLEKVSWATGVIVGILAIYEFLIKRMIH